MSRRSTRDRCRCDSAEYHGWFPCSMAVCLDEASEWLAFDLAIGRCPRRCIFLLHTFEKPAALMPQCGRQCIGLDPRNALFATYPFSSLSDSHAALRNR